MFGYATNETSELMPATIQLSHQLVKKHADVRRSGDLGWLRPDAKSQVTILFEDGKPKSIDTVVLSTQHDEDVSMNDIQEGVMEHIIKPILPEGLLTNDTQYLINPTGNFIIGGPVGDCGLTGRKIIVDTYGGMARHGGGAFSGKDPSKVDRSAAYAARYVAKNVVAAGLADRCEIQVSYAIGVARPTSVRIKTFGTEKISEEKIVHLVNENFDLTPYGIMKMLDLLQPIYEKSAAYGHFGRENDGFPWEMTDRSDALKEQSGLIAIFTVISGFTVSETPIVFVRSFIIDAILLVIFLRILTQIFSTQDHYTQSLIALFGTGALFNIIASPLIIRFADILGNSDVIESGDLPIWLPLLFFAIAIWSVMVMGHIFSRSMIKDSVSNSSPPVSGILVALFYMMINFLVHSSFLGE